MNIQCELQLPVGGEMQELLAIVHLCQILSLVIGWIDSNIDLQAFCWDQPLWADNRKGLLRVLL